MSFLAHLSHRKTASTGHLERASTTPGDGESAVATKAKAEIREETTADAANETPSSMPPQAQESPMGNPTKAAVLHHRMQEQNVRSRIEAKLAKSEPTSRPLLGVGAATLTDENLAAMRQQTRSALTKSKAWSKLDPKTRTDVLQRLDSGGPTSFVTAMQLSSLTSMGAWESASASSQTEALKRFLKQPTSLATGQVGSTSEPPSATLTKDALLGTKGFSALSKLEQRQLLNRVNMDGPRGRITRQVLDQTINSPAWAVLEHDGTQSTWLRNAQRQADLTSQQSSPGDVGERLKNSKGWTALAGRERQRILNRLHDPKEFTLQRGLDDVSQLPEFARASTTAQAAVLRRIDRETPLDGSLRTDPPNPQSHDALSKQLKRSEVLPFLAATERDGLNARLQATGSAGESLRGRLSHTLEEPSWFLRTPKERAQSIRTYLDDTKAWPTDGKQRPGSSRIGPPLDLLPKDAIARVDSMAGFSNLSDDEQDAFRRLLAGPVNQMSRDARRGLPGQLHAIEPDDAQSQAQALRRFLGTGPHVPGFASSIDGKQTPVSTPTIGEPVYEPDFAFKGTRGPAQRHEVRLGAHALQVYVPADGASKDEDAPYIPTVKDIALGLAHLSPEALSTVRRVVVNPVRAPGDEDFAKKMERPGVRAGADASKDGTMTFYPHERSIDPEKIGDIARHEAGHFHSNGTLDSWKSILPQWVTGGREVDWEDWSRAGAQDIVKVSAYGATDGHEDYAEAYGLYMATRDTPLHDDYRDIFPNRFALLDRLIGKEY